MARRLARLVLHFVIGLLACSAAVAQERIKIQIANDTVLVPVRIGGRDLNFVLDTGSELSAIDSAVAAQLGLAETATIPVMKDYRDRESQMVEVPSMNIGARVFAHQSFGTVPLDSLTAATGLHIDGVVGNDVLEQFPFRVDYSKAEMLIGAPTNAAGSQVSLHRTGDEFYMPLRMTSVPVQLLLDTGANSTNLSWGTWQEITKVWRPNSVVDGIIRAGMPTPSAFFVCLPSVSAGATTFNDQVVRVQRQVSAGAFSIPGFGGILGSDFLKQFEVTFDLAHDQIFLKKDPRYKRDPYRYTTVGIQFAKDPGNGYVVMGVWKNSPAEEAGIEDGDRIVSVNGQSTATLSTGQFTSQLHGEEGTPVRLLLRRNSVASVVTLHTRQLLCTSQNVRDMLRAAKK